MSPEWRDFIFGLLQPGIGVKRWVAVIFVGTMCMALGVVLAVDTPLMDATLSLLRLATFSGLPPVARGAVFVSGGGLLVVVGLFRMLQTISRGNRLARGKRGAIATLYRRRVLSSGPRIVAIGGGTGLSTALRGLKAYTGNITAIVAMTDDGGSSGRLRSELGIPPPGDARACLVALSDEESLLDRALQYRFDGPTQLGGHSLGNLMLTALMDVEDGFQPALDAMADLLGLAGRVVPVSLAQDLVLVGETAEGAALTGESAVGHAEGTVARIAVRPENVPVNPGALEAVRQAELITIGPGSLYTSIIPSLLFPELVSEVNGAAVPKVFVCNVATQEGETDGFGVEQHVLELQRLTGVSITHVVQNDRVVEFPREWAQYPVLPVEGIRDFHGTLLSGDVVDVDARTRHDPSKLAEVLLRIR